MPKKTKAYLEDGRYIEVTNSEVRAWREAVQDCGITESLASWYTQDEDNADEIQGTPDDDTRCDHDEHSHQVVNESQTGDYDKDKPSAMTRVCHRRACILDAMAWVERNSGETAAWAAPGMGFRFDVPTVIVGPLPVLPAPAVPTATVLSQGSRLGAIMADHDRGPEYAFVQCTGNDFAGDHVGDWACTQTARIDGSKYLSDEEVTTRLAEAGWSVKPTLCPKHNISVGQAPLPVPEMAP
ncbi:hypothetical protein WMO79_00920 [Micrococcaceae bacterium Sec7.4]